MTETMQTDLAKVSKRSSDWKRAIDVVKVLLTVTSKLKKVGFRKSEIHKTTVSEVLKAAKKKVLGNCAT